MLGFSIHVPIRISILSAAGGSPPLGYTRLGVWSRPPAQADPLARGKPGIDVAFPLLPLGVYPDCQVNDVPTAGGGPRRHRVAPRSVEWQARAGACGSILAVNLA
jgi:hypothetical protein